MKKLLLTLFISIIFIPQYLCAAEKGSVDPVSMVSYEQTWRDNEATIALKNNTQEDVHNVSFDIEYLDMNGTPVDYKSYSYNIDIAPGKTKKLDIPAYEHDRNYHYYKSEGLYSGTSYKLRYEFNSYNTEYEETDEEIECDVKRNNIGLYQDRASSGIEIIILLIIILVIIGIYVGSYVLVAVLAKKRNRNPMIWLLLSFVFTPVLMCIILLAIGKHYTNEF